jgi:hypothetical protein
VARSASSVYSGGYLLFDEIPEPSFWAGTPLLILAGLLTVWPAYRSRSRLER